MNPMARTLSIALGEQVLPFQIGYQLTETFAFQLASMGFDRLIVVADSRVFEALDEKSPQSPNCGVVQDMK